MLKWLSSFIRSPDAPHKRQKVAAADGPRPIARVAVVGGGVGGAVATHFLREMARDRVSIDVYEKDHIGGRIESFEYEGQVYELGASIAYHGNLYFRDLVDQLGLARKKPKSDSLMMIYDGKGFVFRERYGMIPIKYGKLAKQVFLKNFMQIYPLQDSGEGFDSPEGLLEAVGLHNYTQLSVDALLKEKYEGQFGNEAFASELAAAVNRVNYNQGNGINAFAGLVSYIPAADSNLLKLKAGNDALVERLLDASDAQVHIDSSVLKITKDLKGRFTLTIGGSTGDAAQEEMFDAVVLASPMELAGLKIEGFDMPPIPPSQFQTTVTTYVRGKLSPSFFGEKTLPTKVAITVTESAPTPFSAISFQTSFADSTNLYKVFSREPLTDDMLSSMFDGVRVAEHSWKAYPHFSPPEAFAPFSLTTGLYYNNALENSASAMEMSAIMGRNSAILAVKFLLEKFPTTFGDVNFRRTRPGFLKRWWIWLWSW